MSVLLGVVAGIVGLAALASVFLKLDAASLAKALRLAGPLVLGLAGVIFVVLGRAAIGGLLLTVAAAWYARVRPVGATRGASSGRRSTVRTAALEMELDHDSGELQGVVLAGRHESRRLSGMELDDILDLYAELAADAESRQLLEAYLDGRFPVWREDLHADVRDGKRVAPGSGAMTKEEAYKVLGLETGASAADIRKAHRRLMQRLHPDLGGTSFLAARINEAKDILLSSH
ncbi:MAG: DnaJ domain-containing protein [Rhizobiaceae bacterium]